MFRSLQDHDRDRVTLTINGQQVAAREGQSVWSAMAVSGQFETRKAALSGDARSAYCAMGVCFECMVEIDGLPNQQACLRRVLDGMNVTTQRITEESEADDAGL
ncbi:Hydrogen cyanide synthase subunit HcnA [Ruegeria denitrificans]|uniref:Hydrogen cyanide synthase subunit HcnA n=1 Tax=Ruegeria denitrificans TaxID=1715692 RepID=A0A0N7M9E4_9RHOB|nr:(2Fe-2S)-binding protein [Ruegeria denitrificans]CUJ98442.1 Hydrogen cyanide synthase subunit HcnA [Ruegeria denitrificans]